jgi:hypothetical protein
MKRALLGCSLLLTSLLAFSSSAKADVLKFQMRLGSGKVVGEIVLDRKSSLTTATVLEGGLAACANVPVKLTSPRSGFFDCGGQRFQIDQAGGAGAFVWSFGSQSGFLVRIR